MWIRILAFSASIYFFVTKIMMATALPPNVHVSKHPCVRAKLSQLRSKSTNARETRTLVHEIATIIAVDALASLDVSPSGIVSLFVAAFPTWSTRAYRD